MKEVYTRQKWTDTTVNVHHIKSLHVAAAPKRRVEAKYVERTQFLAQEVDD